MLEVLIINPKNTNETWELPCESIKWSEELNKVRTGSVNCAFYSFNEVAKAASTTVHYILTGGPREIHLKDSDFNDPLLFRGVLRTFHYSSTNSEASTITLDFADLGSLLACRMTQTYHLYDQVEAGQIFASELAYTNNIQDTGISMGLLPTTKKRQRTVKTDNLLDLITGMSNLKVDDGFDFQVDNLGHVNIYQPTMGTSNLNVVFDINNSRQPQVEGRLLGMLSNKVYVQGGELTDDQGQVTQEALLISEQDTTSQSIWGLQESYLSATDIATEPFLRARGQKELQKNAYPLSSAGYSVNHLNSQLALDAYSLGDIVQIDWPTYSLNMQLRVIKKTYQWDNGEYQIWAGMTGILPS